MPAPARLTNRVVSRVIRLVMVVIAAQRMMASEAAGVRSQSRAKRRCAVSQPTVRQSGPRDTAAAEAPGHPGHLDVQCHVDAPTKIRELLKHF